MVPIIYIYIAFNLPTVQLFYIFHVRDPRSGHNHLFWQLHHDGIYCKVFFAKIKPLTNKNKGFVEGNVTSNVRYNNVYAIYINKRKEYIFYISIKFVLICWGVFNPTLDVNPCKTFSTTYAHNSLLTMSNKNNKIHLSTTTNYFKISPPCFFSNCKPTCNW